MKYDFPDARYVLERASARESTARVAAGAIAKQLLETLGIAVASHVIRVGDAELDRDASWPEILALQSREEILLGCVDEASEQRMKAVVDKALRTGDSVGACLKWWPTVFLRAWENVRQRTSAWTECWQRR